MNVRIRTIQNVGKRTLAQIDNGTSHVAFRDGQPIAELVYRDNHWYSRPFDAPRSVPFRGHLPHETLRDIADRLD